MTSLSMELLGGFEARLGSGAPVRLPTKKAQALLAYLALRRGRADRRDKLASLLGGPDCVRSPLPQRHVVVKDRRGSRPVRSSIWLLEKRVTCRRSPGTR